MRVAVGIVRGLKLRTGYVTFSGKMRWVGKSRKFTDVGSSRASST